MVVILALTPMLIIELVKFMIQFSGLKRHVVQAKALP